MRVAVTTGFVLCLAALLTFGPRAFDTYRDRQHRLVVDKSLSVYQTAQPPWVDHGNSQIARVIEHGTLAVTRIRYEKDYMVVRVRLADGQQGYVFSGDGFHLAPPNER
jgi:hypothetical protein